MEKRITEKKNMTERTTVKRRKRKAEMLAVVAISLCNRGDEWQERLSDKPAHIKAVKRNKSSVAANPSVAESLP